MKISFENEVDDIVAFNGYCYDTDHTVRKQIRKARFLSPIIFMATGLFLFFTNEGDWIALVIFGALSLLWIVFWPMWNRARWMKRTSREISRPENSNWLGRREMDFSDESVGITFDKGEEKVLWSVFIKADETPDYFFLFQTLRQALVIPKQKITPAEVEELRSLFARHIAVNISETKNKK